MDASIKSLHKNIMEWLAGPAGSITLHAALILALIFLVSFATKEPTDPGVEVTVVDPEELVLEEEPLEELEPPPDFEPMEAVDIPQDVDIDMPPPEIPDFAADSSMINDVTDLQIATDISSPIVMKGLQAGEYANRSGQGRASAGGYAGQWAASAEAAVKRALIWLKNNQGPDGSWGREQGEDGKWKGENKKQVGLTGLGVLTFLAHGETPASDEFGDTVLRAIKFLLAKQNEKGEFCKIEASGGETAYSHAIGTYAISEAYGMTSIPDLKVAMEKAVDVLIRGQEPGGGYDYGFATTSSRQDVSLEAWCCQAMQAARIAGAENPGLDEAIEKTVAAIKRAFRGDDGSFSYTSQSDSDHKNAKHTFNTTAMAVLAMQLTGHGNDTEARRGVQFLNDAKCRWNDPMPWPMYGWYYISQVKFHVGKDTWTRWNAQFAPEFIRAQILDEDPREYGSWRSAGETAEGREFDSGYEKYHRSYATTLAALTLQVYYRHLQTYKPVEEKSQISQKDDSDVVISIF